MKADLEQLEKMQEDLFRQQCDLDIQKAMVKHFIKKKEDELLTLTDVVNCNFDESKQLEEEFEINHLINDTYQVVGKDSSTVWKQGTMEECNDWVMLQQLLFTTVSI